MKQGLPRIALPLAAAFALAVGLAACGGSGSSSSSAVAGSTQTGTGPGGGKPPVTLGVRSFAEQLVLGQLYKQALEARGFTVALKQNIVSTQIADRALRSGQIDLYPEYVGNFDATVARDPGPFQSLQAALATGRAYARAHGFELLPATPFSDIPALAVLPAYARAHHLASVADLAAVRGLTIGAPPEFRVRRAGLVGLAQVYGIRDATFAPLTIGLQYQVLTDGKVDAVDVSTTDGQLQSGRYVLLTDPRHVFGFQNVTPVVSASALRAEGPAFAATLNAVSRALTLRAMQQLNAAVALDRKSAVDVAREFLQANGLV